MIGDDASEIIQGMAIAVKAGLKKSDFDNTIGIHPTSMKNLLLCVHLHKYLTK